MVALIYPVLWCISALHVSTNAQWIVRHSGLPTYNKVHPKDFLINIGWSTEEGETTNITLNLIKSDAVGRYIPLFGTTKDGRAVQTDLINLKHTTFYRDITTQASLSLTSFDGEPFSLKGSFLSGGEQYDVEPFHPNIHKRSLGAVQGDHVVYLRPQESEAQVVDYIMPDEDSEDFARLQRSWARFKKLEGMKGKGGKERKKRQTLPDTTYIVQLYIIVDVYAYNSLVDLSTSVGWSGTSDDFIAFYIGHQASEIDTRYRNIDSNIDPIYESWTIGTKLSYLHVAKTTADSSSWTYPPTSSVDLTIEASPALSDLNDWVNTEGGLPADADHYMLITSLDLLSSGDSSTAGLAYVGGTCGTYKTSINELTSTTVHSHELGHNLGAQHDGSGNSCSGTDYYVMASSSGLTDSVTIGNPWYFSDCSVEYFDSYIIELNAGTNCLVNDGDYVNTWAGHYDGYLGQEISLDEQCELEHGSGYTYYTGEFDVVCQELWCWTGSGSYYSGGAAFRYTTCGNQKWCVEESCVYDANAPQLDEDCPFGDSAGTIFGNSDMTCSTVTQFTCGSSSHARDFCCATCPTLATPWLGPDCPWGDTLSGCEGLSDAGCASNAAGCCDSCCSVNGAAAGYSCEEPSTTTSTTTTAHPTTTTTPGPATTTTPAPTTTTTTPAPTTTTTPVPTTTTTPVPTTTTTPVPTTTTPRTTTTTTLAPTIASTFTRGIRPLLFHLVVRITNFLRESYLCTDPDLQDSNSDTFKGFTLVVCLSFKRHVRKVTTCVITQVSCGSIVVDSTVAVEQNDNDNATNAAPADQAEFLQQISGIVNDTELVVVDVPVVSDVNECEDSSLNDCSPNAACTNTDGYYTCACNSGYEDISEYVDEPGRTCTEECDEFCSSSSRSVLNRYLLLLVLVMAVRRYAC